MEGKCSIKELSSRVYTVAKYSTDVKLCDVEKILRIASIQIVTAAVRGEVVSIPRFGKFMKKNVNSRYVNLPNGEVIRTRNRRKLVFKPSSAVRDLMW